MFSASFLLGRGRADGVGTMCVCRSVGGIDYASQNLIHRLAIIY